MTRRRLPSLLAGFASLSLDPSPRLGALRDRLRERDHVADAWNGVAEALTDAAETMGRDLRRR